MGVQDVTPCSGNQAAMFLGDSFGGELWLKKGKNKGRFIWTIPLHH